MLQGFFFILLMVIKLELIKYSLYDVIETKENITPFHLWTERALDIRYVQRNTKWNIAIYPSLWASYMFDLFSFWRYLKGCWFPFSWDGNVPVSFFFIKMFVFFFNKCGYRPAIWFTGSNTVKYMKHWQ